MRVIAGKFRSRKLSAPPGTSTRPTSDRLRETLFNVIGPRIVGSIFLDLYAGTGAVGIEAISRGAANVVFVESDKKAAGVLRANLASLDISVGFQVFEAQALPALRFLERSNETFAACFLDPPYGSQEEYVQVLNLLAASSILAADAIVIAEHDKHYDPGARLGRLERYRKLTQGDAVLSFYRRADADRDPPVKTT